MGYRKTIKDNNSPQKPETKQTGDWGEEVAVQYLVTQGCAIREQKWRNQHFEIDIIAQRGRRIIFVEVKTRKDDFLDPVEAVDHRKRQHMMAGADVYLKSLEHPFDYQFDIISIIGTPEAYRLEHVEDAFFPMPRTRSLFKH